MWWVCFSLLLQTSGSRVTISFWFPTRDVWVSWFFHILVSTWCWYFFILPVLNIWYIVISHLIYISPKTNKLSAFSFVCWPFFCWEVSIWVFHPIFHWVICIFKLSCRNFFLYSDYASPLSINVLQYFLPAKKISPPKKTNLSTNPWRVIKCFYILFIWFF